nr:ribonuclease R [Desulfobulbaceae bacterium]
MTRRKKRFAKPKVSSASLRLKPARRVKHLQVPDDRGQRPLIRDGQRSISEDDIVGFVHGKGKQATATEIAEAFDLGRSYRKKLYNALMNLCDRNILTTDDEKLFFVGTAVHYVQAELSLNPRGFGFARIIPSPPANQPQEIFIPARKLGSAMHGDTILIKVLNPKSSRPEGAVVRVIERGVKSIVGIYSAGKAVGMVIPEDERFAFSVMVRRENSLGARQGEAVVAKITEFSPQGISNPKGEIIEVLGDPDSLNVQTEIVIRKFDLPHSFDAIVEGQVAQISPVIEPGDGRLDLRVVEHITIDGETARDFDDAVAVRETKNGYQLHVSIADVSHYVTAGSPLDLAAYERGTSVYFPNRVVPMLPERLSNDLCSLVPNQDRYAFSAIIDFDASGKVVRSSFGKSIINSRYRMTYDKVWDILSNPTGKTSKEYAALAPSLKIMETLGQKLLEQRMKRGSIGFELPEAFVVVGENDEIKDVERRERNFAHQIIEEFMLAANEAVATTIAQKNLKDGIYRIHETPDPLKVEEFSKFAKDMGMQLPKDPGTPQWFGKLLEQVKGSPQEYIINNLLLRTMKQARYSPENVGHFGLAAEFYTHFTSPIRRYPDLMVHRCLANYLGAKSGPKKAQGKQTGQKTQSAVAPSNVHEAGEFLSKRERVAVDAEREMVDRLKVRYMKDKVGESFDAIVSGAASFGLFVELVESFVSGGVAIADLKDDYYQLDEKSHRLVGKRTNRIFQLGDLVRVRLASVDVARGSLNFEIDDLGPSQ